MKANKKVNWNQLLIFIRYASSDKHWQKSQILSVYVKLLFIPLYIVHRRSFVLKCCPNVDLVILKGCLKSSRVYNERTFST
jgi:hypothetical protein